MHKDGKGTVANSVDALGQFICAAFDGSGFGTQAAAWRDQLTALMTGAEIAAANSKAQVCAGQTGAKVGARTGMIEPSDAPSAAASHDRLSNISNTSSASSAGGRTEFGKSPMPQSVPLQIFYFPARATINGAEFFADLFDFEALVRDLRHMADLRNDLFIALFALFEPPRVYRRAFGSNIRLLFHVRSRFHRTSPLLRAA